MRMKRLCAAIAAGLLLASCTSAAETTGDGAPDDEAPRTVPPATSFSTDRCSEIQKLARVSRRGWYPKRSPQLVLIPKEPNFIGSETALVHSGPWDYLTHVPFVMYGPGFIEPVGDVATSSTMADLAPTTARLIGFDSYEAPDGVAQTGAFTSTDKLPRLVVTIVWDGGGWNALEQHPGSWPYLEQLMTDGASYVNFSVGSNPSVTPAIHTTIGTGAFPDTHGIVGLRIPLPDGRYVNPLGKSDPSLIEVPTLADLFDRRNGNRPITGMLGSTSWHVGMVGHGAGLKGGDKDPVALLSHDVPVVKTNRGFYSLPALEDKDQLDRYVRRLDASDGKRDVKWMGRSLVTQKDVARTPAMASFNQYLLEQLIRKEGFGRDRVPDLLYVNFKSADLAGHAWSFEAKEQELVLRAQDDQLRRLVNVLDRQVGAGKWVVMLTADHGQTAYPKDTGAWPVRGGELADDLNRTFDRNNDGIDLVDRIGASGASITKPQLAANSVSLAEMARWIGDYRVRENLKSNEKIPAYYQGGGRDRIFDAVMSGRKLVVPDCSPGAA